MIRLIKILLLLSVGVFAQYGNQKLTGWTNGDTYTYDTFTASGANITSAIETTANIGGCYSNMLGLSTTATNTVFYNKTQNSGNFPKMISTISTTGRGSVSGTLNFTTGASGSGKVDFTTPFSTIRIEVSNGNSVTTNYSISDFYVRQKLDTLYISAAGDNANLGDADNPIATIAEALERGFYDGGVFAFRAGDTFAETFTAGNNCTLAVYGGSSPVTISTIADGGFTVTQSALINPVTDKKTGYGGFNGFK